MNHNDLEMIKDVIRGQTEAIRENTAALLTLAVQMLAAASGSTSGTVDQGRIQNVAKSFDDLKSLTEH